MNHLGKRKTNEKHLRREMPREMCKESIIAKIIPVIIFARDYNEAENKQNSFSIVNWNP